MREPWNRIEYNVNVKSIVSCEGPIRPANLRKVTYQWTVQWKRENSSLEKQTEREMNYGIIYLQASIIDQLKANSVPNCWTLTLSISFSLKLKELNDLFS